MTKYYLQLTQPTGERSFWKGYCTSKKEAEKQAAMFKKQGWKVIITTKPSKWN